MPSRLTYFGVCSATVLSVVFAASTLGRAGFTAPRLRLGYLRPQATKPEVEGDKVWALGRTLFFDTSLSASGKTSCASCHVPDQSWSDHLPKAIGDGHKELAFRAPTLLNAGHIDRYGWSGRFEDVDAVAFFAMSSPTNMNFPASQLLATLAANPRYVTVFREAFPDGAISKGNVGTAISRYVRSITSGTAPFDRWVAGDMEAISPSAARGFRLFTGKAFCAECHSSWTFTDGSFHDIGIGHGADLGRGTLFKTSVKLQYAFKTPTLRNVAVRAPYMHDGSIATLEGVVDHYDKGGIDRPSRAENIEPLHLSPNEKADLVAFLKTLTSDTEFVAPAD